MQGMLATALALLLVAPAAAAPTEITHMTAIESAVRPDSLVIFDIDNTLLEPTGFLASDQWFYYLLEQLEQREDEKAALADAIARWNAASAVVEVRPIEPDTAAVIGRLQARGIETMALTARSYDLADVTFKQLAAVGIDFSAHAPHRGPLEVPNETTPGARPSRLIRGVIFVDEGNDKGKVLVSMLTRMGAMPKHVVYVDDKEHHVVDVGRALAARGIALDGFRYGAADPHVETFKRAMAELADPDTAILLLDGRITDAMRARIDAATP